MGGAGSAGSGLLGLSARQFLAFVYFVLVEHADEQGRAEIDDALAGDSADDDAPGGSGPLARDDPRRRAAIEEMLGAL